MASAISSAIFSVWSKTCAGTKCLGWTLATLPLSSLFALLKYNDAPSRQVIGSFAVAPTITTLVAVKGMNLRQLRELIHRDRDEYIEGPECRAWIPQIGKLARTAVSAAIVSYTVLGLVNGDNVLDYYKDPLFYYTTVTVTIASFAHSGMSSAVLTSTETCDVRDIENDLEQRLESLPATPPPTMDGPFVGDV